LVERDATSAAADVEAATTVGEEVNPAAVDEGAVIVWVVEARLAAEDTVDADTATREVMCGAMDADEVMAVGGSCEWV
jgi:hypothetical protein